MTEPQVGTPGEDRSVRGRQGAVAVWRVSLTADPEAVGRYLGMLVPSERGRAEGYRRERDRDRWIVARAGLRRVLARHLGCRPGEVRLHHDERGKPALAGPSGSGLSFNLSHSADLAVVAVTDGAPVGVDVEQVRPVDDAMKLAERYFAPGESAALAQLQEPARSRAFLTCWTRKEAVLKATGAGLGQLARFEVGVGPARARVVALDGDAHEAASWRLLDIEPASGYVGAVAILGGVAGALEMRTLEEALEPGEEEAE